MILVLLITFTFLMVYIKLSGENTTRELEVRFKDALKDERKLFIKELDAHIKSNKVK